MHEYKLSHWRFEDLSNDRLYAILRARAAVFVVEQTCPFQDLDDLDQVALHLVAENRAGALAGYLRLTPPGTADKLPAIGRVLTTTDARGWPIAFKNSTPSLRWANPLPRSSI